MSTRTTRGAANASASAVGIKRESIAQVGNPVTGTVASSASPTRAESSTPDPSSAARMKKKRLGVDPSLIISEERSKRRKSPSPTPGEHAAGQDRDPRDPVRAKELGSVIYKRILGSRDQDGEDISQPFVKLPNKRSFPDYYETIKHPMSLEMVHAKLEAGEYQTLKDVCADLGQIFNNAKRYNMTDSLIFQYAKKLHKMTRVYYADVTSPEKAKEESDSEAEHDGPTSRANTSQPSQPPAAAASASEAYDEDADAEGEADPDGDAEGEADEDVVMADTPARTDGYNSAGVGPSGRSGRKRGTYMRDGPTTYKLIKPVLKAIKEAKARDGSGREIAAIFMRLPDRRDFPDYYRTIRQPISLEEIESKQMGRRYEGWQEFFDDVNLMCNNAMEYNEDASEVYNDAREIKDLLAVQRNDVLARIANPNVPKLPRGRPPGPTPGRPPHMQNYGSYSPSPAGYGMGGGPTYPPGPSMGHSGGYNQRPSQQGQYLPPLPLGIVNEEVVNSLERYPAYEQQTWAQSLNPLAMSMYRSILATNEARKRGLPPQPSPSPYSRPSMLPHHSSSASPRPVPSDLSGRQGLSTVPVPMPSPAPHAASTSASAHGPSSLPAVPAPSQPVERTKPTTPAIQHLDLAFSTAGQPGHLRESIRLRNFRGVITHAVLLDSKTSEIEVTAYLQSAQAKANEGASINGSTPGPLAAPELSLRLNGTPGSLPHLMYPEDDGASVEGGVASGPERKPKAIRWNVHVPITKVDSRIEVVATRPGMLAETTTIYVSRQY
ncbi:hypothetical protein IAU60_005636 [Kwoniella sp. DSM 27419]